MILRTVTLLSAALCPVAAAALELQFPVAARRAAVESEGYSSVRLPITAWQPGGPQTIWAEGEVHREAWQLNTGEMTTLQILSPLREQLVSEGFDIIFECREVECGGFDFRFATDVMPAPEMYVDLGDYRYLAAQRIGESQPEYVSMMVSRAANTGFVQVTWIGFPVPLDATGVSTNNPSGILPGPSPAVRTISERLDETGRAVLADLRFATGSSDLSETGFRSLETLSGYLEANPSAEIVLVGHTDAEGSLAGNIALSKARAASVRDRLAESYGIAPARMRAEGVGFLAPVAPNTTEEGRTLNRRVEVVLSNPG